LYVLLELDNLSAGRFSCGKTHRSIRSSITRHCITSGMAGPILVVEDRRVIREGMVRALSHEGFVGIPAANGQEALDYLKGGGEASVIVLDMTMPVMNGWAFRKEQQDDPQIATIPTIILSGLENRPVEGAVPAAILQKPVDIDALVTVIRSLCGDG
jgi:CheY-like chemotaxis protein